MGMLLNENLDPLIIILFWIIRRAALKFLMEEILSKNYRPRCPNDST